jgi:hypothetical protein
MECEKVREKFSSLLEGEMNPEEEKVVREHLVSCLGCQKDFDKFRRTIHWLHSVEEVEVPEGFLSGVHEKMEHRKRTGLRPGWFHQLAQLKLPAQAVAMVAIVFLVLYLNKMMPVQTPHLMKAVEQKRASQAEVAEEARTVPKETGREEGARRLSSEMPQKKKMDGIVASETKEKLKSATASIQKAEAPAVEAPRPKVAEKAKASPLEPEKIAKAGVAEQRAYPAGKPPQEIALKISDAEKALSQLHELVRQFGGEIVQEEGNMLVVSLPAASFPEFGKKVVRLVSLTTGDQIVPHKESSEGKGVPPKVERGNAEERDKELARPMIDKESRIFIRILLVQE